MGLFQRVEEGGEHPLYAKENMQKPEAVKKKFSFKEDIERLPVEMKEPVFRHQWGYGTYPSRYGPTYGSPNNSPYGGTGSPYNSQFYSRGEDSPPFRGNGSNFMASSQGNGGHPPPAERPDASPEASPSNNSEHGGNQPEPEPATPSTNPPVSPPSNLMDDDETPTMGGHCQNQDFSEDSSPDMRTIGDTYSNRNTGYPTKGNGCTPTMGDLSIDKGGRVNNPLQFDLSKLGSANTAAAAGQGSAPPLSREQLEDRFLKPEKGDLGLLKHWKTLLGEKMEGHYKLQGQELLAQQGGQNHIS